MIPLIVTPDRRAACPECFPGDTPAALPHTVDDPVNGSLRASYRCPCGWEWTCWWSTEAAGWPAAGPRPLAELISLTPNDAERKAS